jgi:hypothetical protein
MPREPPATSAALPSSAGLEINIQIQSAGVRPGIAKSEAKMVAYQVSWTSIPMFWVMEEAA